MGWVKAKRLTHAWRWAALPTVAFLTLTRFHSFRPGILEVLWLWPNKRFTVPSVQGVVNGDLRTKQANCLIQWQCWLCCGTSWLHDVLDAFQTSCMKKKKLQIWTFSTRRRVKLLHTFKFAFATSMHALSSSPTLPSRKQFSNARTTPWKSENYTLSGKLATANSAPADGHLY